MRSNQLAGRRFMLVYLIAAAAAGTTAVGQVQLVDQFNTELGANLVGVGYDEESGELAVYRNFDQVIRLFDPAAASEMAQIDLPGNTANDFDIDVLRAPASINGILVPAHTLLILNGDDSPNRIYAVDPATGAILAEQIIQGWSGGAPRTSVGGSFHHGRGTFYAVDYHSDVVAEVDLADGAVLQEFSTGINVYFGDVEVSQATGNLLVVTDRRSQIREISPDGLIMGDIDVTEFVSTGSQGIAGIATDDAQGIVWLGLRHGQVVALSGVIEEVELDAPTCAIEPVAPVACQGSTTTVQLWGTASGDLVDVDFEWTTTCPGGFDDPTLPSPLLSVDTALGCAAMAGCEVQLIAHGPGGASTPCVRNISIVDTTAPSILIDVTDMTVRDQLCDGQIEVRLPGADVLDTCDPAPQLTIDGPEMFAAGERTAVIYTAIDDCGNVAEHRVGVTVEHGAALMITVRTGGAARHNKGQPLPGVEVMAFDLAKGGCAQSQLKHGNKKFDRFLDRVLDSCDMVGTAQTDERGVAVVDVPPGRYLAVARTIDAAGVEIVRGVRVGRVRCGQTKRKLLIIPMKKKKGSKHGKH